MQDVDLKATAPQHFQSGRARLDDAQSARGADSRESRSCATPDNGARVEAEFWRQCEVGGRSVTVNEVLKAYQSDTSSLRSGFFLQDLFLQKMPQLPVSAEQVVAEFRRLPDRGQKYRLAIARFQASCLLKGINLNGQPVSADAVADAFPKNASGRQGLARFRENCCLRQIPLDAQPVTPESVAEHLQSINASLELAHFKSACCLNKFTLRGRSITPKAVIDSFPDTESGKQGIAQFKTHCNQRGWHLDGKIVSPEAVLNDLAQAGTNTQMVVFKARCCLNEQPVNGQLIPPEEVLQDFHTLIEGVRRANRVPVAEAFPGEHFPGSRSIQHKLRHAKDKALIGGRGASNTDSSPDPETTEVALKLAQFKADCCLQEFPVNGKLISPETVVKDFQTLGARLELARFNQACCLARVKINGQLLSSDAVANELRAVGANLELAHFTEACFAQGLMLCGQPVSPDMVVAEFKAMRTPLALARFKQQCCVNRVRIAGRPVSADDVAKAFSDIPAHLELARFMEVCCLEGMLVRGSAVPPDTIINHYRAIGATREMAHFRDRCLQEGLKLSGQPITTESVLAGFHQNKEARLSVAHFEARCCLAGQLVNGRTIKPEVVIHRFPATRNGRVGLARFKEECCIEGVKVDGQLITPETVLESFPNHQEGRIALARFKERCCLKGLHLHGKPISPDMVVADYPLSVRGRLSLASFKALCCTRGLVLAGQQVEAQEVIDSFPNNPEGQQAVCHFLAKCCMKNIWVNGQCVTTERVALAMERSCSPLTLARFKARCCLSHLTIDGMAVTADAVKAAFPDTDRKHLTQFLEQCCLNGLTIDGQLVPPEQVAGEYEQSNQKLEKALFYARLTLQARKIHGRYLNNTNVLTAFDQLPGNHTAKKVDFLLQRLMALPQQSLETPATLRQAWQLIESAPVDDEQCRHQRCILEFLAIRLSDQPITHDQVWQSIKRLRQSLSNLRLRFFFLAHCFSHHVTLDGRPVSVHHVLECLRMLPVGNLRHQLERWFDKIKGGRQAVNLLSEPVSQRPDGHALNRPDGLGPVHRRPKRVEVYINSRSQVGPLPCQVVEYFDDPPRIDPALVNQPTRRMLTAIQGISQLRFTGSFSRCLQGLGSSFNDINLLSSEAAINLLISQLNSELDNQEQSDGEVACQVFVQRLPGCPELHLPTACTITLSEGDLGEKAATIEANIYPSETLATLGLWQLDLPWDGESAACLPVNTEARLLNATLRFLTKELTALTGRLLSGACFNIPRTILFNFPQTPDERVFGLLMRCLLSINKAMQFIELLEGNNPAMHHQLKTSCHRLLAGVQAHRHCQPLTVALRQWLCRQQPNNVYLRQRCDFIRHLLTLIARQAELP